MKFHDYYLECYSMLMGGEIDLNPGTVRLLKRILSKCRELHDKGHESDARDLVKNLWGLLLANFEEEHFRTTLSGGAVEWGRRST